MNLFKNKKIRVKLLVTILLTAIVPLILLSVSSMIVSKASLENSAFDNLEAIRDTNAMAINKYFIRSKNDLMMLLQSFQLLQENVNLKIKTSKTINESYRNELLLQEINNLFSTFKEANNYEDLFLIKADGYIEYSVEKRDDFQTNLLTGYFMNSNLAHLIKTVLNSKSYEIVDFKKYEPYNNNPAAFMGLPVIVNNEIQYIIASQISLREINSITQQRTGLSESIETFLVGTDNLMRSDSRFLDDLGVESSVLNPEIRIDTKATQNAFIGISGTDFLTDFRDIKVLSSWTNLIIHEKTNENAEDVTWALISKIDNSEIQAPIWQMIWTFTSILIVSTLIVIAVSFIFASGLTKQVDHIMTLLMNIGMGDFDSRTKIVSHDELGEMAVSLNAMLENTMNLVQSSEERDEVEGAIMNLLEEISGFAEGDLTRKVNVTTDITGAIADAFNDMSIQLSDVIRNVKIVSGQVRTTSGVISDSTHKLASKNEQQVKQIKKAISAINLIATAIANISQSSVESAEISVLASKSAKEGSSAVFETNKNMEKIRNNVQETSRAIKRLGESSLEIGNIIQIINDISDRTSILALNASIQAAMAGDAGHGFAVVAEEVQRLAERSTNSTKQIETLIKNIQSEINEAGISMDESIQCVVDGTKLAGDAYSKLKEIDKVSDKLSDFITAISSTSIKQAEESNKVTKIMENVGAISAQSAIASMETAKTVKNMTNLSQKLHVSVEAFKIGKGDIKDDGAEPVTL